MNYKKTLLFILLVFIGSIKNSQGQNSDDSVAPFMPEIISQFPSVRDLAISPDGSEIYFTAQSILEEISVIMVVHSKYGIYSKAEPASFTGSFKDMEPFMSDDGLKLYFVSNRPLDTTLKQEKDFDIWYVERANTQSSWSEPINLGSPVNTNENEFYPSIAKSGTIYFTNDGVKSKGKDDIFYCKFANGSYEKPVSIGDSINTTGYEFNAFIAPDEGYIIYTGYNKPDGLGSGDLYISYRKNEEQWTTPVNLGTSVNSPQMDYCPFIDNQGFLYFTSRRTSVNPLKNDLKNTEKLLEELNKYDNGLSRIYRLRFKK